MKSICYVLPYFGKLPSNFQLYLLSCKMNPTINWLVFTDDHTSFDYPLNVKVIYTTFDEIRNKIQSYYDFKISCDYPWRLCVFRPAYGEIFSEYLKEYDFWGYCDCDMMWGDIRYFITDDILEKYDRIGRYGHSTIFKNNPEVNVRYKTFHQYADYRRYFSKEYKLAFDEKSQDWIYWSLKIGFYDKTIFAHLNKFEKGFYLGQMPKEDSVNNRYQIFTWEKGKIFRYYLDSKEKICKSEFMYIHFFCRPMKFKILNYGEDNVYYMYPDVVTDQFNLRIDAKTIKKYGTRSAVGFYLEYLWRKRHKMTLKKIDDNIRSLIRYRKKKKTN